MNEERVKIALEVYAAHRWSASAQQCACGAHFPASLFGHAAHKQHRMSAVLMAADRHETGSPDWCDSCGGPYIANMEEYGGHWAFCPRAAKALPPKDEE